MSATLSLLERMKADHAETLSQAGDADFVGVSETPPDEAKPKRRRRTPAEAPTPTSEASADSVADSGELSLEIAMSVSVTWAKETYATAGHSFDIGPFEATGRVRPGETVADAHERIYAELVLFAEAARTAKAVSNKAFLLAIGGVR